MAETAENEEAAQILRRSLMSDNMATHWNEFNIIAFTLNITYFMTYPVLHT